MGKDWIEALKNNSIGFEDTPASYDALGLDKYFEGLSEFILRCPTPMTIAIQGGWGSGKTTAMRAIRDRLESSEQKEKLLQIEFNTWQYARAEGEALFVPLLRQMAQAVRKVCWERSKGNKEDRKKYNKTYKPAFRERNKIIGAAVSVGTGIVVTGLKNAMKYGDGIIDLLTPEKPKHDDEPREYGEVYDYVEGMKERLDAGIELLKTQLGIDRIVFYIDDLDRLEPELAVSFLEDLKNLFVCRSCVFVLALDHEIVWRGIQKRYSFDQSAAEEYSSRFFDKLIQLPFSLPCHQYDVERYVTSLLGSQEPELCRIIRVFGDNNPRSIKRLLNIVLMYLRVGDQPYQGHELELLALLLLQICHEKMYQDLVSAIREDLADPMIHQLRSVFRDLDVKYRRIDACLEKYREENGDTLVGELELLFGLNKQSFDSYQLLFDIVGATALTGTGIESIQQRTAETEKLIERYLGHLGFSSDDQVTYLHRDHMDIEIEVKTLGSSRDHVNLNITSTELDHAGDGARIAFFQTVMKRYLNKEDRFEVLTVYRNYEKTDILYTHGGICCLRGLSVSDADSMLLAGGILRSLSRTGYILPKE